MTRKRKKKPSRDIPLIHVRDRATGVEVAVHGNDRPTPEALRHGEFDPGWQVGRETGKAFRRVDSLTKMNRNGTITDAQLYAGLRFRTDFDAGRLGSIKLVDLTRIPGESRGTGGGPDRAIDARDAVAEDIRALGGQGAPLAEVAWWVIGLGLGVEDYARRATWSGRPVAPKTVTGLVIGALDLLARTRRRSRSAA
jgi:hypothetical protein